MRVSNEMSLRDLYNHPDIGYGACDTIDTLELLEDVQRDNCVEVVEDALDSMNACWDMEELNDFLWFETDVIAEWLGFEDWDALSRRANEEDEEEEDEDEDEEEED